MKKQLDNVKHDYIRYANCWEDADVLLKALDVQPTDRILSVASAGDNSFSLLSKQPEIVVAVDVNPVQLSLVALKKAAFTALNHADFLAFLGFEPSNDRILLFEKVNEHLPETEQKFWNSRKEEIEAGIIYTGKFERYFKLFRVRILPLIHTKKRIKRLFETKDAQAQVDFFNEKWNNRRWRLLFKLFFSKFIMGRFGRDPAFLKEVEVPVSEFIIQKAKTHLSSTYAQSNYFLHFIMTGTFGQTLPHYARAENFEKIKANINRLVLFNGVAEETFTVYGRFHKFNLSNIFEYMPQTLFENVTDQLINNGSTKACYVYWNLMVPRKMHEANDCLESNEGLTSTLRVADNGFFYDGINISLKK